MRLRIKPEAVRMERQVKTLAGLSFNKHLLNAHCLQVRKITSQRFHAWMTLRMVIMTLADQEKLMGGGVFRRG